MATNPRDHRSPQSTPQQPSHSIPAPVPRPAQSPTKRPTTTPTSGRGRGGKGDGITPKGDETQ